MFPGIVADAGNDEAAAAVAVDFLGREVSAAENGRGTVDGGGEDVLRALSFTRQKFVVVSAVTLTYWSFVIRPVTFTLPMVAFFSP